MRKLTQRHEHWAPCKSIKNQIMTESTMDMWQLDWCICALCRADISASTFRLALQILNGCGTEVVERCGSSNDQSTAQQETAGCYSTMKCIYPTYNILQNNECWSTRQAGPPNWLTRANCCSLREMSSKMERCVTRRREEDTPAQVVVGRYLVRSKSSQELLGVCSDANSTAGVGQDLVNSC